MKNEKIKAIINHYFDEILKKYSWGQDELEKGNLLHECKMELETYQGDSLDSKDAIKDQVKARIKEHEKYIDFHQKEKLKVEKYWRKEKYTVVHDDGTRTIKRKWDDNPYNPTFALVKFEYSVRIEVLRIAFLEDDSSEGITGLEGEGFTHKHRALYFYYLAQAGEYPLLITDGTKSEAFRQITDQYGGAPNSFRNEYNEIEKEDERHRKENIKRIEKILPYLKKYPKALQLAENELLKIKKENKWQ